MYECYFKVSEENLEAAREVASQAREAIRRACGGGVILALPGLPGHPPARDAPQEQLHAFEDRVLQLTALAALAGAPQVGGNSKKNMFHSNAHCV